MTKNIGDSITLSELHDVVMHPDKTYLLGKEGDCIYKTNVPDTITLREGHVGRVHLPGLWGL